MDPMTIATLVVHGFTAIVFFLWILDRVYQRGRIRGLQEGFKHHSGPSYTHETKTITDEELTQWIQDRGGLS